MRHRVVVVTSGFGDLPRRETRGGVEIVRVPVIGRSDNSASSPVSLLSYPPVAWYAAWRLLRSEDFDLIHSHFAVPTGVGSLPPARAAGLPHVISLHGGDIYDPSKPLSPHRLPGVRSAVSWVMRGSDAVVAQSRNTRENAYKYYSYDGPIEILPLGVRHPEFARVSRVELGLPEDRFLAVTVGRLVKRKRVDQLLEALSSPGCEGIDLLVIGEGPESGSLRDRARELGMEMRVRFLGRVSEERKWQLLAVSDVYASATQHEGFGLVYLEAMTVGLPVVTFDHGGQVDFIEEGVNGYLVSLGDIEKLSGALSRVRSDPESAARIRANNLRAAPEHHIENCAKNYETLFERLVSAERLSPRSA